MKRGEGVEMSKLDIEKLTRLTKQVFFGGVSQLLLSMIVD